MSELLEKVVGFVSQAVEAAGCELVNLVYVPGRLSSTLQVFADKEKGGLTVADCATISRQLGDLLELHDTIPGSYRLEVSSPGLNRPLKTHDPLLSRANFIRFSGQSAVIKTVQPLTCGVEEQGVDAKSKGRKTFKGQLQGMEADDVLLHDVDGTLWRIPLEWINKAWLEFKF